ncbi:MAG: DUF1922 domain-containing protein, partial [Candidatus Hermodarchaeota archaeon]
MEKANFKKDLAPYFLFECKKCKRVLYVKSSQKTKKCLNCGAVHLVQNIKNIYKIVHSLTEAINQVKVEQNQKCILELSKEPELRAMNDYNISISNKPNQNYNSKENLKKRTNNNYYELVKTNLIN